jgi:hypothetical protein
VTLPTIYEAHFQQSVELFCNAVIKFSSRSRHVAASIGEYGPPEERDRVFVRAKIPNLVHNVLWCLSVLVQIFARNIVLGHLVRADLRFVSATIPEFDRPFCQIAGTGCVLKIGGNKIGFASARISSTVFLPRSALRPTTKTWMPSCASFLAVARPIPLVPPVISAVEELLVMCDSPAGFTAD